MPAVLRNYPGKASLEETKRACINTQDTQKAKLVHLQGGVDEAAPDGDKFFNQAQFASVKRRREYYAELDFIDIEDEAKIPEIVTAHLADHFLLIFNETLFVGNERRHVLGFGKFAN